MTKKIEMKGAANSAEEKKFSYEQLEQIAHSLDEKCKEMYKELMEARNVIAHFNEIGMLLSIIDKGEFFDPAFIERCCKEIQDTVTQALDASVKQESSKDE